MAGIGIAMIALLVAWAWVRHTARAVVQPLRRISRTVAALEAGRFDARCNVVTLAADDDRDPKAGKRRAQHEFANLAHDINRLAERLQRNRQLSDEKVREATAVALQRMAEAEQAALSRARFLAAASHDLRQPLLAMALFIDGLLPTASPMQLPAVLRLRETTDFMGAARRSAGISRLDAGVGRRRSRASWPRCSINRAQHAARPPRPGACGCCGRTRRPCQRPGTLVRIVGNLVSNARCAIHRRTACVRVAAPGPRIRIEVGQRSRHRADPSGTHLREFPWSRTPGATAAKDATRPVDLARIEVARHARQCDVAGQHLPLDLPAADPAPLRRQDRDDPIGAAGGLHCLVVDGDPAILDGSRTLLEQ
jgi:signal transduction histidine kinase